MPVPRQQIVEALHAIAPPHYAEDWDNVGLIVAPPDPRPVSRTLLCIDMTAAVVDEAVRRRAEMVIAYHPPLFQPTRRLDPAQPAVRALAHAIAVYSPHTALDAAPDGVNDWLADGLGQGRRRPIQPIADPPPRRPCKIVVFTPPDHADDLRAAMSDAGAGVIGDYTQCSFNLPGVGTFKGGQASNPAVGQRGRLERVDEVRLEMICPRHALPAVAQAIQTHHPYEEPAWDLYDLQPKPHDRLGQGRRLTLDQPATLDAIVQRIKQRLGLDRVRLAHAPGQRNIKTIALCAGAGGSVLSGQSADLYWTGEMRHHDVLAANARGVSVVLCDHTNTERPYLKVLRQRLARQIPDVKFHLSRRDREPLQIT